MNLSLEGKTALVCGASQGIGRAAAQELALLGARVLLMARNASALEALAAELPPAGAPHAWIAADLREPQLAAEKLRAWMSAEGEAVHVLVNNSGGPPPGNLLDAQPEDFFDAYRIHLIASHLLAQAVVGGMKQAGYGRIINVISTSVRIPIPGLAVSNTTRGAVASWAKTLSNEVGGWGITVNNVLPGFTETGRLQALVAKQSAAQGLSEAEVAEEMKRAVPAGRFAAPEEVAALIAFLASPAAGYINGTSIPIDGGRTGAI
jgi:3-oxoacyl-[acyl-carrier protein] reductase